MSTKLPVVKAKISPEKCTRDHRCLPRMHCPSAAIEESSEGGPMKIDEAKCIGCGKCVKVCHKNAIMMERYEETAGT